MKLAALVDRYMAEERPVGTVLDPATVHGQAVAAASFVAAYAELGSTDITAETDISLGNWALIRPLFVLYTERENALMLESTRGLGLDVFGRMVSEISSDITMEEQAIPEKSFCSPIQTV